MSLSNYLENELLDHLFGCGSKNYIPPSNIYLALSTADPGESGATISEPSGGGYVRVSTNNSTWGTATSGSLSNSVSIDFPEATSSWGTITHFALYDAASGGNMLAYGALTSSQSVTVGKTVRFGTDALTVSLT